MINEDIKNNIGNLILLEYYKNGESKQFIKIVTGIIKKIDNYNIYFKINGERLMKLRRKNINKIVRL